MLQNGDVTKALHTRERIVGFFFIDDTRNFSHSLPRECMREVSIVPAATVGSRLMTLVNVENSDRCSRFAVLTKLNTCNAK